MSLPPALLQPSIATWKLLTSKVVHGTYYPYTLFTTLHALRVSIVYQNNVRSSNNKGKLTWGVYLAGYLMMAWGGTVLSHLFLSLPPPYLYNYQPYVNYISVHILATLFFHFFPSALDLATLDPFLAPLDAILRSTSIASTLSMLTTIPSVLPKTHAVLTTSPLAPIILGAAAASGGGVMAGTMKAWTNDWSLGTVTVLKVGLVGSTDVWSGAIAGFIYTLLTRPHLYPLISTYTSQYIPNKIKPQDAQATISLFLLVVFTWRVFVVHYSAPANAKKTDTVVVAMRKARVEAFEGEKEKLVAEVNSSTTRTVTDVVSVKEKEGGAKKGRGKGKKE